MKIMKWGEANKKGLAFYFTGVPCKNGHTSRRTTLNGNCTACKKDSFKKNRPLNLARTATYRALKKGLTPPIIHRDDIGLINIYEHAKLLEIQTRKKYHVDHIWPISKGGVHHPCNLQILEATTNLRKSASHDGVSGVSYEDFMLAVSAYA